jgi:hypothetical protein
MMEVRRGEAEADGADELVPTAPPASAANGAPGGAVGPLVEPAEQQSSTEPALRVPEAQTPLPEVDQAMPLLGMFAEVVGRRRARYKIAR